MIKSKLRRKRYGKASPKKAGSQKRSGEMYFERIEMRRHTMTM
jgi:hypothetical protein